MRRAAIVAAVSAVIVLAAAVAAAGVWRDRTPAPASATATNFGMAPAYRLTDQNGQAVASTRFAGEVQVVSFLFPYCTTYCPVTARRLVQLQTRLEGAGLAGRVQLLAFNVDPGGAGPQQLRTFIRQYGGNPADPSFTFLTGTPAQIHQVVWDGFHVAYQKVNGADEASGGAPTVPNPLASAAHVGYDVVHNDFLEIVGPDGRIEQILDQGSMITVDQLYAAISQARRATGS